MEGFPQLSNLITRGISIENKGSNAISEDKKLELSLGPPGDQNHTLLSLYCNNSSTTDGAKRGFQDMPDRETGERNWLINSNESQNRKPSFIEKPYQKMCAYPWSPDSLSTFPSSVSQDQTQKQPRHPKPTFLQYPMMSKRFAVKADESSQPNNAGVKDQCPNQKESFIPHTCSENRAVPNSSQERTSPSLGPIIGWPPIRSSRKNLAISSSLKQETKSTNEFPSDLICGKLKNLGDGLFVKINMDGVPIGRKIDLNAYDNYEKLSSAVDELFKGLLAAQTEFSAALNERKMEETKVSTGLLDGSGEYTLVYEDNEGDRMLVGDVPWHMFVSSAKRLRLLKRSELSTLHLSSSNKLETTPPTKVGK